jgi:hypothetical protein
MRIRRIRDEQGQPIETLVEGDDARKAVGSLYEYGRRYPHGRPHDYAVPETTPTTKPPQPGFDEYRATFREAKNSAVSPAPSEQACQFPSEKVADHNDTREAWVRGMGNQSPHPFFDNGVSGHRYSRK